MAESVNIQTNKNSKEDGKGVRQQRFGQSMSWRRWVNLELELLALAT